MGKNTKKLVSMRLSEVTLNTLELLQEQLGADSKAQAIASSTKITNQLFKMKEDGAEIFIKKKNGEVDRVLFV